MTTVLAQPPVQTDDTAVRGLFQRLLDAWGRGDGSAYGALFTDDADYVAGEAAPRPSRDSFQTLVAIRRDGEWRFTAFHNTRILRRTKLQWMLYGIATKLFHR